MLDIDTHVSGTSFICNAEGNILRVLRDDAGMLTNSGSFFSVMDIDSQKKAQDFWKAVQNQSAIFNQELNVITPNLPEAYKFSGFKTGEEILISASKQNQTLESLVEELMAMLNETQNMLRLSEKKSSELKKEKSDKELNVISEMTELNNEMVNMQRTLAKKNAEINRLNSELEERVKMRTAELTEANKALETFSYSLSHDLRTPINTIISFSKLIKKKHADTLDSDLQEMFSHIDGAGKRMGAVVEGFLTLVKGGNEKLNVEEVDIAEMFNTVWNKLMSASTHKATLTLPNMPMVYADKTMLLQVVTNLLTNAIKFSANKEEPHVVLGFSTTPDSVTVSVSDNGVGFDMQYYDRLFGAFQSLHNEGDFEGTGIGLALVKRIIERHGGRVWAEAKVPEGATFYFTLPQLL